MRTTRFSRRKAARLLVPASLMALALAGVAHAGHWANIGWRDVHYNYPPRPSGYSGIVNVFGQPCNSNAGAMSFHWTAADDRYSYLVRYHKKLGGAPVPGWAADEGGLSTNLDNDVRGHIGNGHLDQYVLSGIWGYVCRYINNTTTWSTHAWGIAIDQNARYEHFGHCHIHTMNAAVIKVFTDHRWRQLPCDPMHLQYATDY